MFHSLVRAQRLTVTNDFLRMPTVNFLAGNMGLANAQRTFYYIRILTEFISQPEYRDLIPIFGIVNEALVATIGMDQITSFYLQAHTMIRNITGTGESHGPVSSYSLETFTAFINIFIST